MQPINCQFFPLLAATFQLFGSDPMKFSPGLLIRTLALGLAAAWLMGGIVATAAEPDTSRGDKMLADYFRHETQLLADRCLTDVKSLADWEERRPVYHKQLREMLGLEPWPEKTDLQATITGRAEHPEFVVEKIHFQSRPGLYVTGNLYLPKKIEQPLPAILYVCGHGRSKKNGISYGNKASYQHHGGWFARNGFACLTIDTLQMGEIEGIHHGTFGLRDSSGEFQKRWWWNSAGYTPAGVEAWNCVRAIDYLQSRKEVDPERIGVTGRSGGGAYSWWIAALDERIKAAVPVAGITDLENHVVDGCVEGHCDCMFMVNTYRWDYPLLAAMVAPRALLISNTDKDRIFPLEGVIRTHAKAREIYRLYEKPRHLGVQITEGGHLDTQELHIHAFVWFNRFLKKQEEPIDDVAVKFFEPEMLRVFDELPADEKNTTIDETFVARAEVPVPKDAAAWKATREELLTALREKSFRGWPKQAPESQLKEAFRTTVDGVELAAYDFTSQEHVDLRLYVAQRPGLKQADLVVLNALDGQGWQQFMATYGGKFAKQLSEEAKATGDVEADAKSFDQTKKMLANFPWVMAYVAPRGVGLTIWNQAERKQTHIRRRFNLLGQTLDGMRTWDTIQAAAALRQVPGLKDTQLWMQGERDMAGVVLYASLFVPDVHRIDLHGLVASHRDGGPVLLNVLRFLDVPQAVALAAENTQVRIYQDAAGNWEYPQQVAKNLNWDAKQLQVRTPGKN